MNRDMEIESNVGLGSVTFIAAMFKIATSG